jgi:hypothetical protein
LCPPSLQRPSRAKAAFNQKDMAGRMTYDLLRGPLTLPIARTGRVGYLWFFGSYLLLLGLGLGLVLLLISECRHSRFVREKVLKEIFALEEIAREGTLRSYWLVMNSFVLLVLVALFAAVTLIDPCPVSAAHGRFPVFLYVFGLIALFRDYFDFRFAWRFLYPVPADTAAGFDKWPITAMADPRSRAWWRAAGYSFLCIALLLLVQMRAWDVEYWVSSCSVRLQSSAP